MIQDKAAVFNVVALHLEVATDNVQAKRVYERAGFYSRQQYHLMSNFISEKYRH